MNAIAFKIGYGHSLKKFSIPKSNLLDVIQPRQFTVEIDETELLRRAMVRPIESQPLSKLVHQGQKIAVVISDLTRPCPSDKLLKTIVEELETAVIPAEDVLIVVALGLHRPMTPEEIRQAVSPDIFKKYQIVNHDPNDTVRLGFTSRGTPVDLFRPLVEADFRICLGNIEFHYFAGFSGGAKAVLPGCASRATVTANHAMMVLPEAAAGKIEGNPLREDIDEAVAMLGVDFILNVVLDEHHRIGDAFAGDVTHAHRKGCERVALRGKVQLPQQADIVVASAGGYPKDINFYQSHKAMEAAKDFIRDGGILITVCECVEGFGNQTFEEWILSGRSPMETIAQIQRKFVIGGHKAAAIAAIRQRMKIFLVSDLPDDIVWRCGFVPYHDVQIALEQAWAELGRDSQVLVIPQAVSVVPEFGNPKSLNQCEGVDQIS